MDGYSSRFETLTAEMPSATARDLATALIASGHRRLAVVAPGAGANDPGKGPFQDLCEMLVAARLPAGRLIAVGDAPQALDRAFFEVFRGTRYPTGLLCADAATADAARSCLLTLGFRVPDELAVVSFA